MYYIIIKVYIVKVKHYNWMKINGLSSQGPLGPLVASSMACKQYKPYSSNQDQHCTNAFPTLEIPTT